ncbi:protein phosphatase 2C domain-containing protein [Nocardia sp. NPDC049220]|uniref:protein phosphatase 2C domain-containing protein n=1 Tax=Nocardia sp. NPDC049220 TaxID=3155273 RepID=UPI0033ED4422
MKVATAQLDGPNAEDRVVATATGLIVLDGATAHESGTPPATNYVDHLGRELAQRLDDDVPLSDVLRASISATAQSLDLRPGQSPSSTVVLLRGAQDGVDVLVLGDSAAVVGLRDGSQVSILDDRIDRLSIPEATEYRARLARGTGFDTRHRELLERVQRQERVRRNRTGGFWIAEADPDAADHAIINTYPREIFAWAVAATDGAFDPLTALGISWCDIAAHTSEQLQQDLHQCSYWERTVDPKGQARPRSKRHDDKTLAVLRT